MPSKVACSQRLTSTRGSRAGVPASPFLEAIRDIHAERSSSQTTSQIKRAGWSGGSNMLSDSVRIWHCERSGIRIFRFILSPLGEWLGLTIALIGIYSQPLREKEAPSRSCVPL